MWPWTSRPCVISRARSSVYSRSSSMEDDSAGVLCARIKGDRVEAEGPTWVDLKGDGMFGYRLGDGWLSVRVCVCRGGVVPFGLCSALCSSAAPVFNLL